MSWMHKLPLKQRIVAGCYLVAALFAIPVLVTLMILGQFLVGIILVVVLAGLTYLLLASWRERLHHLLMILLMYLTVFQRVISLAERTKMVQWVT